MSKISKENREDPVHLYIYVSGFPAASGSADSALLTPTFASLPQWIWNICFADVADQNHLPRIIHCYQCGTFATTAIVFNSSPKIPSRPSNDCFSDKFLQDVLENTKEIRRDANSTPDVILTRSSSCNVSVAQNWYFSPSCLTILVRAFCIHPR